jgi:hypothetical protein
MKMRQPFWRTGFLVAISILLTSAWSGRAEAQVGPASVSDGRWHFVAAPYLWFTGLKGDVSVKGVADIPIEKSFSDVLSSFHFGFLGHFEARKNRFGVATDLMYIDIHVPVSGPVPVPVTSGVAIDTTVKQTTVEGIGFYRVASGGPKDNPAGLDFFVGARYYRTTNQLNATLPGGQLTGGGQAFAWVDGLAGLRLRAPLGSRVSFIGRGDVAGFGSKFTWNLEGDLAARVGEHWAVGAGWRHMSIDYEKAETERKLFDLAYDGPRAWFSYAW